jgi:organic radical activating enzyme
MDFKLPSSTKDKIYWEEHTKFLKIASTKKVFVKAVITSDTKKSDIERAITLIKKINAKIPFIIQPVTPVKKTDKAVPEKRLLEFFDMILKNDIKDSRIIPQTHKALGIR